MAESLVTTSEFRQSHRGQHRGRCAFGEISNVRGSKAQHRPHQDPGNDKTPVVVYEFGDLSLSKTQTRMYRWCSPPRIGNLSTRPAVWTSRGIGASFFNAKCERTS